MGTLMFKNLFLLKVNVLKKKPQYVNQEHPLKKPQKNMKFQNQKGSILGTC